MEEEDLLMKRFGNGLDLMKDVQKLMGHDPDDSSDSRSSGEKQADATRRHNMLCQYDIEKLLNPSKADLMDIYKYYDNDNSGLLDHVEIRLLAIEIIERTYHFIADEIIKREPQLGRFMRILNYRVQEEAYFYLPGDFEHDKQCITNMVRFLATALDPGSEGTVTRARFINIFPIISRRLWTYVDYSPRVCAENCVLL